MSATRESPALSTNASQPRLLQLLGIRLAGIWTAASEAFQRDTVHFSPRHLYFGLVAGLGFPLYYVVWQVLFPQPYESLLLRLVGTAVFVPIIVAKLWPESLKRFFPLYWYLALLFALPFFFTYMLLMNGGSTVWLLSTLVALFVMILLLDWINLLVHIVVGVTSAVVTFHFVSGAAVRPTFESLEYVPIYMFAIVMGIIVNYSADKMRAERRAAMLATAGMVAHELRTPLLSVKSGASGLRHYLPELLAAYRMATDGKLIERPIRPPHLDALAGVLDRIEMEADRSNTVIDMLLYTVRGMGVEARELGPCRMSACVDTALRRYPFASEKDRALVMEPDTKGDFSFTGSELLMVHVIFNLLKNALRHIAMAGKGMISIRLETDPQESRLVFRDTGPGIPPDVLPHVFTRYYAWPKGRGVVETTGIGLSFCREVVQAFGGQISCNSHLHQYTEFVIRFPGGQGA
ncbi:MAG TPA: HAMP domain-containing sensor histidine kinase [Burkholderiales bacterium]|nr:HAMP domain-containing sensor histidine kinase [Burkholderiales bacterium]